MDINQVNATVTMTLTELLRIQSDMQLQANQYQTALAKLQDRFDCLSVKVNGPNSTCDRNADQGLLKGLEAAIAGEVKAKNEIIALKDELRSLDNRLHSGMKNNEQLIARLNESDKLTHSQANEIVKLRSQSHSSIIGVFERCSKLISDLREESRSELYFHITHDGTFFVSRSVDGKDSILFESKDIYEFEKLVLNLIHVNRHTPKPG